MDIHLPQSLRRIAAAAKSPIYIVGGHVRNSLLGLPSTDIDICGPVAPQMLGLPPEFAITVVNFRLGTALIRCGGDSYEYTPFRIENYVGGQHTPSAVYLTDDITRDCARRDFAANAIYYDIASGQLVDMVGGVRDIQRKVLRAVSRKTFSADGLRILRLVRMAAQLGFGLDKQTVTEAVAHLHFLDEISAERKRTELEQILTADTRNGIQNAHYRGVKLLHQLGIWPYIIPAVAACAGMAQNPLYHKYDVLEHSLQAVKFAPPAVRRAALLHDVGKPAAFAEQGNTYGHEVFSANLAHGALSRLKYSNAEIRHTVSLVRYHMYDMQENTRIGKMRIFVAQHWDLIDDLVALKRADWLATGMPTPEEVSAPHRLELIRDQMLEQGTPIHLDQLEVSGADCVEHGIEGPSVGELLRRLHRETILAPHLNNRDWLLARIRMVTAER